ncbi:helix-turn-helix domain-containing protein [Paenibacillus foliorum]|nr:helix-turn-helix domain-containing protein [Paenibacillus foliorum]
MVINMEDSAIEVSESPVPGILLASTFRSPYGYYTYRPNGTRDWLITYTLSGSGIYSINNRIHRCSPGDLFLLSPGTPHNYRTAENEVWHFMWAHFVPNPTWSDLLHLPRRDEGLFHLHISRNDIRRRVIAAFRRIIRNCVAPDEFQDRLAQNAMEELLLHLARYNAQFHRSTLDSRILSTLEFLNNNMQQTHTVERLASRVLLSPSRFAHLFKSETGDSVIETLLKIRLRHASRLLAHTTLSVAEVSDNIGFRDPLYFSKQFSSFFGMSPTAYRRKNFDNLEALKQ